METSVLEVMYYTYLTIINPFHPLTDYGVKLTGYIVHNVVNLSNAPTSPLVSIIQNQLFMLMVLVINYHKGLGDTSAVVNSLEYTPPHLQ